MEYVNTTIGEIIESTQTGKTPNTKEPLYYEGDVLWVTPTDLQGQQYLSDTKAKISELALLDNQAFLYRENTVLISCIGDIGKTAIVKKSASSNQQITGVRVKENLILPKFFYYWIIRNKEYLNFKANRVTISILNNTNLKKLNIGFPKDLEFQSKVVSQLDITQSFIDHKIQIINTLDGLVLSIYRKIFGSPIVQKSKWSSKKLKEIGEWKTGGTPLTSNSLNYEGEIPWFTSGELGKLYLEDSFKHISEDAIRNSNVKLIKPNSILIGLYDTAAFKMSISTKECTCNQAVIYGKLTDDHYTVFVYYSLLFAKEFYLLKRKGARQKNLNSSFIKNIEVIYPANEEEKDKVNLFYKLHSIINEVKEKQINSLEILRKMFQSILQNAFKPDVEIDEEPIFKDLIKKFTAQDLRGNKQRLQYLINLFEQQSFEKLKDFTETRKILFELMEKEEIIQIFENENNVKLQVK